MPGIAGILAVRPTDADRALVHQMVATLQHRSDDATGTVFMPECGVCAGWVAHADSFAAKQCSVSLPGAPRLIWSGECFDSGLRGTPSTAPEADDSLLARYDKDGEQLVGALNGLFSGLLIDPRARCALLFNDRYGSERLFVHEKDGSVYFASEAKALLRILPEVRAFDEAGVADFLAFGSTLEGRTLFRNVEMLPGASLWRLEPGSSPRRSRYFRPDEWESQDPLGDDEFEARFIETFGRIMTGYAATHGAALGVSLTGGLDTRMIMASLPCGAWAPACYTYAGAVGDTLDLRIGRRIAASRGLVHHALRIPQAFAEEYGGHLDRTVYVSDGSAGALGAHELVLSQQAHEIAPVRLTGNFGSEILRSMSTFKRIGLDPALITADWQRILACATRRGVRRGAHSVTHAAFEEIPWHLSGTLQAARSQLTVRTPYLDNEIVGLAYRASASLRRSTLPAMRLIQRNSPALSRIPTDRGLAWTRPRWRSVPRRLFCAATFKLDYWHKEGLPSALSAGEPMLAALDSLGLLGLHKFLPYRRWFRHECAAYLAEVVADVRKRHMPFWAPDFLAEVVNDHVRGRSNRLHELNAILTLEAVDRVLIGGASPAAA
jgi:asparagine synthase (glutamine-hydrolysing)